MKDSKLGKTHILEFFILWIKKEDKQRVVLKMIIITKIIKTTNSNLHCTDLFKSLLEIFHDKALTTFLSMLFYF